ncbi:HD domain-containing phosphohydrolase [Massilia endophytica]|uniref:HD domain-containing phosphohydrolase n=1 Tax=Massilia endophytica TaxID=2899220 RepID=UPI001E296088|nr:HD domain-containing phosphohydrolase [Massilia endophytica]UGQ49131.1 response regulator [Massilia endophytica]
MTMPVQTDNASEAVPATVLCVDDEPNILASLRRLFRSQNYRVLIAESGAQGLAVLEKETVDLVISDMRMPEMDGARFLAQVCERWPHITRMLLTGYADIQSIQDAINSGQIYRYITKPWDDNEILLSVRHALERHALEAEKRRLEELTRQQNEELKELNSNLEAQVEERTRQWRAEHEATMAANEKLKRNYITTIKVFSSMMEQRIQNAPGHAREIAELVRLLCGELGLDARETQDVFVAALLHDIGKIGFSDELLATPYTLLQGESLHQYRKHPLRAEQLLMPLDDLRGTAAILRAQMERFDGNGFPDGRRGLEIPLGARILAPALDYYNLQQGHIVQRHLPQAEARALIVNASGKRYDPNVVAAFSTVVDGGANTVQAGVAVLSGELRPGMTLAADLVSREGLLLLPAEHVMEERMIQQVLDFETKSGARLSIRVHPPKPQA